ncbi:DUF4158 domain-containing protein [Rhodococcus sp. PvR099]|uniref:DUF4158 domain-containing protein n=1 Tax=Rhodococcus sp. PvR099 TaxID=2806602 RepID=UPI001AE3F6DD|nr:DUF4158 domain-containing protein [Rhodococcus sp. PvR099]MBP1162111.1 hypothetical protein [Rhodococcus sp. PvR099]
MDGGYGRVGSYSRVEMERFFHPDVEDRRLIAARRRDYNRLGYAVQMITVCHLGMFLTYPLDVPPELVEYPAEQLGIDDPACLKDYADRRMTRFEHQAEITQEYHLAAFADVEAELAAWIADQAWMTGDGPKVIFEGAVAWLRACQTCCPASRGWRGWSPRAVRSLTSACGINSRAGWTRPGRRRCSPCKPLNPTSQPEWGQSDRYRR